MTVAPDLDLLERSSEVAVIEGVVESARRGAGTVVLVEGEAGIGKTRLVDLAGAHARAAGLQILRARGCPLERGFPFGVTRQLFEPAMAQAEAGERRALLGGAAAGAEAVLLNCAPEQDGSPPDLARVSHGLYRLCSHLTERAAMLLAIDDAHWSDRESLRWLSYMANRVGDLPLVLFMAAQSDEQPADAAALAAIASVPGLERLRLAPLSERSSARVVRGIRGPDTADEFCRACHAAAGGNPLWVRELSLESEQQAIAPEAISVPQVARMGPRTIARATRLRIARLSESCAALAGAIAVLGLDVEVRDAATLAGMDVESAQRAADALAAAGLLRASRPLNFKHPVIGTAIYAELPLGARSQAHARAAALLAGRGADAGRVGAHLLLVEPAADALVLRRLRAAATDSLRRGAPATAVGYLRRALAETGDAQSRVDVLFELGRATLTAGDPAALGYLMDVIDADPHDGVLVEAVALAGSALQYANRAEDAHDLIRRAIDRLGDRSAGRHSLRLEGVRMQVAATDARFTDEVREKLPSLLARAEQAGAAGRPVLVVGALDAANRGDVGHRVPDLVERGLQRGRAIPEEIADSTIPTWGVIALVAVDALEAAEGLLDALAADARARGSVHAYAATLLWRGWIGLRRGLIPAAETDLRAAAQLAAQRELPLVRTWASAFLAGALLERGDVGAAAQMVDHGLGSPERLAAPIAGVALDARGRVRIAQGRHAEGIADLRSAGEFHESIACCTPNLLHWRSSLAIALGRNSTEALALVDVELERARPLEYPRAIGVVLRARGLLQGGEDGLATLREATAVLDGSPARLELARTLVHLGAALRRDGRRAAARQPLSEALDLADRLGAEAVAEQALAELAAAGARPRRRHLTGAHALTPTERRIADMAAAGPGNKDIAQALFISVKTVEMHLGRCYRKLAIHSRRELPAVLSAATEQEAP